MHGGFREKFARFMIGRYGIDEFGKFLNIVTIVLILVSFFVPYLSILIFALFGYNYFRIFSKNVNARAAENRWFCSVFRPNKGSYSCNYYSNSYKKNTTDKSIYKIFKCPNCAQKIRVPRHKGKICIKCPKCRIEFIKKT